jgi:hypothetical protein
MIGFSAHPMKGSHLAGTGAGAFVGTGAAGAFVGAGAGLFDPVLVHSTVGTPSPNCLSIQYWVPY